MTVKATFLFRDGSTGWTETFYFAQDFSQLQTSTLTNIAEKRSFLMGRAAMITGVRASDPLDPKRTRILKLNVNGAYEVVQSPDTRAEQPHVAALVKLITQRGSRRFLTLPGVPDEAILRTDNNADSAITLNYSNRIAAFVAYMLGGDVGLRIRERNKLTVYEPKLIKAITVDDQGRYKLEMFDDLVVTGADKVAVTKVKGNNLQQCKGIRRVINPVPASKTFVIDRGPFSDLGDVIYNGGGYAARVGYDFVAAFRADEPVILSTRKRGRPFGSRRGRRSARR